MPMSAKPSLEVAKRIIVQVRGPYQRAIIISCKATHLFRVSTESLVVNYFWTRLVCLRVSAESSLVSVESSHGSGLKKFLRDFG